MAGRKMAKKRLTKNVLTVVPFLLLALLFLGGIYYVLLVAVDRVIEEDAAFTASHWTAYLTQNPEEVRRLESGRGLSRRALAFYRPLAAAEQIIGFKLVEPGGAVRFETTSRALTARVGKAAGLVQHREIARGGPKASLVASTLPLRIAGQRPKYLVVVSDQATRRTLFDEELIRALIALTFLTACSFGVPAIVFLRERTQKEQGEERIEFLAQHDLMTNLMNRSSFNLTLDTHLSGIKSGEHIALHFIDLDRFKSVNDSLGHNVGDELIKSVATRLRKVLGSNDLLARFGGDEFVLAQDYIDGQDDAERRAAIIRQSIGEPFAVGGHQITTTVSIGTAIAPQHGHTVIELTKSADLALYAAKADGRDACRMYHPDMDAALHERQKIEKALRRAAALESFELHFQPIVRAEEKKLLGFEVLLRLQTEDGEDIPPTAFIPIAENMGLISQIGSWVIRKACQAAAEWPDELTVSVNLSPRQFENGELCGIVETAVRESGLAPPRLELEITEGLLISDVEGVMSQLRQLKSLGVSVAMDDFGTGYSSLSYLWRFPFDKLKIDRSFMSELAEGDEHVASILNTIVALGRTLNLKVTAEGVETQAQADLLKQLNCDQLQGYHFGRPMPESDVAAVILRDGIEDALNQAKIRRVDDLRQIA